uniref:Uncharacterized protein n=1 Tax=Eutreptiella gymnastica TaxID=73025 RepID=A0A7S4FPT8_9EUGL
MVLLKLRYTTCPQWCQHRLTERDQMKKDLPYSKQRHTITLMSIMHRGQTQTQNDRTTAQRFMRSLEMHSTSEIQQSGQSCARLMKSQRCSICRGNAKDRVQTNPKTEVPVPHQ